jgi:hypothetical protein
MMWDVNETQKSEIDWFTSQNLWISDLL